MNNADKTSEYFAEILEEIDDLCNTACNKIPETIARYGKDSTEHSILCAQMVAHATDFEIVENYARLTRLENGNK